MGKTLGQLREELSNREYTQWRTYFGRKAQRLELAQKAKGGQGGGS